MQGAFFVIFAIDRWEHMFYNIILNTIFTVISAILLKYARYRYKMVKNVFGRNFIYGREKSFY